MKALQVNHQLKVIQLNIKKSNKQLKAKMICQFFFSSIEGDFSWPVASFPVQRMNSKNLKVIVWKVIEVLSKTKVKNKHIQVLYGVCDGSSYSPQIKCSKLGVF